LHGDVYFLSQNSYFHYFFSTIDNKAYITALSIPFKAFIADTGFLAKETSALLLDLCDKIEVLENTFDSNWSVSTGDSYWGSSINIYRAVSFHGLNI
jgi:hypothetical protein